MFDANAVARVAQFWFATQPFSPTSLGNLTIFPQAYVTESMTWVLFTHTINVTLAPKSVTCGVKHDDEVDQL